MRTISEVSELDMKITVFYWNNKYILKFEKGMYEQTYKISEMDIGKEEDINKIITNTNFLNDVRERFKNMNTILNEALNKL
ncbi:MAG: hypothetical protein NZ529_08645 [Cytophagaceae bacterium]|nr:hypothetical protein [Cytophagaceae bacterium]MDW8456850.1 hypothetical protein [Cytophagaceae bacterium]